MRNYREISRRVFLDPEYGGVNMSVAQLESWIDNPNHRLASTATGLNSLSRLPDFVQKPESRWTPADYAFAKKVLNFNRRHAQQVLNAFREDRTGGFGREVGKSGWSKRHIALRNWGHDPSDQNSPLYAADQAWLDEHPGAEHRRTGRLDNPDPEGGMDDLHYTIETADIPWDGDEARRRLVSYARTHGNASGVYSLAFLMHPDTDFAGTRASIRSYKLPVMDVIGGRLTLVPGAVSAAEASLHGARGGVDGSRRQKTAAEKRLRRFKKEIQRCRDREETLEGYRSRPGLEGPFRFRSGKILYYDPREGAYYDPGSDVYVSDEDMTYHLGML